MIIKLAEEPHLVIQGEGQNIGTKMILLRLFGCPVKCKDCDSKNAWSKKEKTTEIEWDAIRLSKYVIEFANANNVRHLLITGGEPLMQQEALLEFMLEFPADFWFNIETSGYYKPHQRIISMNDYSTYFNVSPKIGSLYKKIQYDFFKDLGNFWNIIIKVVVSKENFDKDLREIKFFQQRYQIPQNKIYLMPKGTTRAIIIEESQFLISKCIELGYRFTPRLHILIFDDRKMV